MEVMLFPAKNYLACADVTGCSAGLAADDTGVCRPCGDVDEICCVFSSGVVACSGPDLVCASGNVCLACGGVDQPCCDRTAACLSGSTCTDGTCIGVILLMTQAEQFNASYVGCSSGLVLFLQQMAPLHHPQRPPRPRRHPLPLHRRWRHPLPWIPPLPWRRPLPLHRPLRHPLPWRHPLTLHRPWRHPLSLHRPWRQPLPRLRLLRHPLHRPFSQGHHLLKRPRPRRHPVPLHQPRLH